MVANLSAASNAAVALGKLADKFNITYDNRMH